MEECLLINFHGFSCRSRKILKNAYLDEKIRVDPAENELALLLHDGLPFGVTGGDVVLHTQLYLGLHLLLTTQLRCAPKFVLHSCTFQSTLRNKSMTAHTNASNHEISKNSKQFADRAKWPRLLLHKLRIDGLHATVGAHGDKQYMLLSFRSTYLFLAYISKMFLKYDLNIAYKKKQISTKP